MITKSKQGAISYIVMSSALRVFEARVNNALALTRFEQALFKRVFIDAYL